ncbi:recombinase family protein [Clostridium estertheticum]|uniref:recombinase family protein n=1 Tax=Clostridium estertheticum TaxID=238834 RepID=UPI001C6E367F|nr:recombinase family protein [Clostridium estertheticum]MBW9171211.1 recombinase family protein [Clostridium estertheticum]WLC73931.1 recombinase family protein [Clostridium estertheticum]
MTIIQRRGPKRVFVLYPLPNTLNLEVTDNNESKLRVAAYCRVSSSSEEQISSYNAQVQYFKNYIIENPEYDFAGIYMDKGISGTNLRRREDFNRLMQDARENKVDMIITKSLSRFGRNTLDCLNSIRELRALGVDVFFEKENIHTKTSEGEVPITLISAVAQNESLNQSENIKWGIRRKYEKGCIQSIPSGKFFGYNKDEAGKLIINEAQAIIVRRIYQEFLEGHGYYKIAEHLTEEGVVTECGNLVWSCSTLKKILTNEKYKGDTLFQKTYNADYLTKRRIKNNGDLLKYYHEDTHPAIIDKNTWECVQLEFVRQAGFIKEHSTNKYHQHSKELPFSGKLICKNCGHTLIRRESKRTKDKGEYYWCCKRYRAEKNSTVEQDRCCNGIRIKDAVLAEMFIKALNQLI